MVAYGEAAFGGVLSPLCGMETSPSSLTSLSVPFRSEPTVWDGDKSSSLKKSSGKTTGSEPTRWDGDFRLTYNDRDQAKWFQAHWVG